MVVLGSIDSKKYCSLSKVPKKGSQALLTGLGMTLPNNTIVTFDPAVWRPNKTAGLPVTFDAGTPTNLLFNDLYFVIGAMYPDSVAYRYKLGFWAFHVPCNAPSGTFD
jgi:hypothetical protein